jgi:hypothetical protein
MFKLLMLFLRTMFYGSVMKCVNQPATTFTFLGGLFEYGDGQSPENFTPVSQVQSVDEGGNKVDPEDITSADNTDRIKRKTGRLEDPGTVSPVIFWNPTDPTHQGLMALKDGNPHNFKVVNPGAFGVRLFPAIIETATDQKLELGKGTMRTIKLVVSGPVVFTVGGVSTPGAS